MPSEPTATTVTATAAPTTAPDGLCHEVAAVLPGVVDGSARLDRGHRRHVEQCLRCQAELAQYRKLLRTMRTLQASTAAVPAAAVPSRSVRSTHRLVTTTEGPPRESRSRASASHPAPAAASSTEVLAAPAAGVPDALIARR